MSTNNGDQLPPPPVQPGLLHAESEKPTVLTSSSSDDGNGSSGVSDGTNNGRQQVAITSSDGAKTSYRDFSRVPPEKMESPSTMMSQGNTTKEPTFPVKLHMILGTPEFSDIISWLPHGRAWRILQQKAFEEKVVPLYFRHGRYSSFARQVNGWGFRRVVSGSDYNSYYHELFLRGLPHLCNKMRRLTAKDVSARKDKGEEPAPDFYALSRDHPLPESAPAPQGALPMAPPAFSAAPRSSVEQFSQPYVQPQQFVTGNGNNYADVELALLEKRRSDILQRISVVSHGSQQANGSGSSPDLMAALQSIYGGVNAGSNAFQPPPQAASAQQAPMAAILQALGALGGNTTQQLPSSQSSWNTQPQQQQPAPAPVLQHPLGDVSQLLQQFGLAALLQRSGNSQQQKTPEQAPQQAPSLQQSSSVNDLLMQLMRQIQGNTGGGASLGNSGLGAASLQAGPPPTHSVPRQSSAPAPSEAGSNGNSNGASQLLTQLLQQAGISGHGDLAQLLGLNGAGQQH